MNKSNSVIFNKNKGENNTIISLGYDLQFDLELSLTNEEFKKNNIDFYEIKNIEYFKGKLNKTLLSLIQISSTNFLFNSVLFINKAKKIKNNIKYIIPFKIIYPEKIAFMLDIIDEILLNEYVTILSLDLTTNLPQINFIINLIENNKIKRTKKINIFDFENQHKNESNLNDDEKRINILSNSINKCNHLITSISNFNNYIHIFLDEKDFLSKMKNHFKLINVCIIYDEQPIYHHLKDIKDLGDITIYVKDIKQYNEIDKNVDTKNKNQNLEIILDELKRIIIIQYDTSSKLVILKIDEPITLDDFYNIKDEEVLDSPFYLESVYIGAFLSRLLNKKIFNTCLKASVECLKKVLKFLKYKKENNYFPNNNNYYEISVKKSLNHSYSQEEFKNLMLEHQFVLDGNNKCEMNKRKEYNSLYDDNCNSYFEKIKNKNFLIKQGFIDKKGQIIINPERIKKLKQFKINKAVKCYQKNVKQLYQIRNSNNITQKFFEKLSSAKEINSKRNLNLVNFNKLNKYSYKDEFYLPSLKGKNEKIKYGKKLYHYDRSKDIILKNLSKRYFEGNKSQLGLISFQINNNSNNNKFYNSIRSNNISYKNNKNKSVNSKKLDCYKYNKTIEFFGSFL